MDPLDALIPVAQQDARPASFVAAVTPLAPVATIASPAEPPRLAERPLEATARVSTEASPVEAASAPEAPPATSPGTPAAASAPQAKRKERATFHVPVDLLDELRDAVVHLSGPPLRLNLAQVVEAALRREVARLRDDYNASQPFPRRDSELRGGRAIS
jgi:hypothetical protein